jgi:hypothetical protein
MLATATASADKSRPLRAEVAGVSLAGVDARFDVTDSDASARRQLSTAGPDDADGAPGDRLPRR